MEDNKNFGRNIYPCNLAELVRAMKLNNGLRHENQAPLVARMSNYLCCKLPSISELDPVFSHTVKSHANMYHNQKQNQTPNLHNTLIGYNITQQQPASQFSMSQVGAALLLSDRQHINLLFATHHPSVPTSLERATKLYRNAASPCTRPDMSTAPRSSRAGSLGTLSRNMHS